MIKIMLSKFCTVTYKYKPCRMNLKKTFKIHELHELP